MYKFKLQLTINSTGGFITLACYDLLSSQPILSGGGGIKWDGIWTNELGFGVFFVLPFDLSEVTSTKNALQRRLCKVGQCLSFCLMTHPRDAWETLLNCAP